MLQFLVDISTSAAVLDGISQAVQAYMDDNATEYKSGSLTVSFSSNDDPLKVQLVVGFEYSHNGTFICMVACDCPTMLLCMPSAT